MQEFSLISELMFRNGRDGVDEAYRTLLVTAQQVELLVDAAMATLHHDAEECHETTWERQLLAERFTAILKDGDANTSDDDTVRS